MRITALLLILLVIATSAPAQSRCEVGVHAPPVGFWTWTGGPTNSPQFCENCLTIAHGKVFDKKERHLTELRAYSARNDRLTTWATIVVDFALTNRKALTDAVAHELGHSFGLRDCYSCKPKSTVMNQFGPINAANDMPGPTTCDVAQVKSTYQQLANRVPPQKKVVIDEGEEPVDDDTPVIVPKP